MKYLVLTLPLASGRVIHDQGASLRNVANNTNPNWQPLMQGMVNTAPPTAPPSLGQREATPPPKFLGSCQLMPIGGPCTSGQQCLSMQCDNHLRKCVKNTFLNNGLGCNLTHGNPCLVVKAHLCCSGVCKSDEDGSPHGKCHHVSEGEPCIEMLHGHAGAYKSFQCDSSMCHINPQDAPTSKVTGKCAAPPEAYGKQCKYLNIGCSKSSDCCTGHCFGKGLLGGENAQAPTSQPPSPPTVTGLSHSFGASSHNHGMSAEVNGHSQMSGHNQGASLDSIGLR